MEQTILRKIIFVFHSCPLLSSFIHLKWFYEIFIPILGTRELLPVKTGFCMIQVPF
jgi:hypothetical protein